MDLCTLFTERKAREQICSSGPELQNLMSAARVTTMLDKVRNKSIFGIRFRAGNSRHRNS